MSGYVPSVGDKCSNAKQQKYINIYIKYIFIFFNFQERIALSKNERVDAKSLKMNANVYTKRRMNM